MKSSISVTGLLTFAGLLACLATLASFAGLFWWGFELVTHFRVQYALALSGCVLILLTLRQWRWSALFGAFALLNLAFVIPAFREDDAAAPAVAESQPTLRALLANVNAGNRDLERLQHLIVESDPDIILLLEATPWLLDRLRDLNKSYPHHVAEPRDDPFGIALFGRPPAIVATITAGERSFTLIGTHPWPPVSAELAEGRNEQLRALASRVRQSQLPLRRSQSLPLVTLVRPVARRFRPARQPARARYPAVLAGGLVAAVDSHRPRPVFRRHPHPASGNRSGHWFRSLSGHC